MNLQYIFGIILAILIVLSGIFLLGRDGTDEKFASDPLLTQDEALPINPDSPESEEGGVIEVETESDTDNIASTSSPQTLEDTNASSTEDPESAAAGEGDAAASLEKEGDEYIVTYTASGFSPKEITVEEGETVRFVNNSTRNMWVASSIHPTHNEYPEESEGDCGGSSFDACSGVAVGGSWEFTFNKIGDWGYHDHLSSSRTGTIVVE